MNDEFKQMLVDILEDAVRVIDDEWGDCPETCEAVRVRRRVFSAAEFLKALPTGSVVKEYKTAHGRGEAISKAAELLDKNVNELIREGWRLYGSPSLTVVEPWRYMTQTLVRDVMPTDG